ncbi:putative addiction module antidote [Rhizobium sp. PP-F2F-G38]|uniref:AbrB/MazE/SpoVT family DNA-binding domain-containing protein n=1 Tax=Ferranicluibacter rubi TaxID=2715133 RepID=A0AA44C9R1_9HYPH|nr:AbrB/MazE/SpoVT family DNA-binding domain-containing protein [Ferranicluibacter rubi]PYE35768.1 putative addiction module antidote [Rhizobium sp. PP-WC-1G-195]PYE46011.1 putative addiction module antidote [Rhizobium sp. PP-F2F-G20b]PYE99262.1 putative addiction module antidote [Rhizobium sp. PP-F2F-G38]TCL96828.1 putative addiction module antidote [Rhizobium sp. PP-WC-2G-219]TCP87318.1 putative addiction module antidote [Rhizobium sp. PP-CC-2G-626]
MNVTVRKIGNSEGVILPKDVLDRMGVKAGDTLTVRMTDNKLELIPETASFSEQLKAARIGMEKYKNALRELAK